MTTALKLSNLVVTAGKKSPKYILKDINLSIYKGKTLGIVGESGCGKSTLAYSLAGLLGKNYSVEGKLKVSDYSFDLKTVKFKDWRKIRGKEISFVFQDSLDSLNPMLTIGYQLVEAIRLKTKTSKAKARLRAIELLEMVEIADAEQKLKRYPHEFSGGMRQRVMIAIALANEPEIIICDEPTTALDVTIQSQILKLLKKAQDRYGLTIIFISHDIGVINEISDYVVVMYAGKIVEYGLTDEVLKTPAHPYTHALLEAMPKLNSKRILKPIPGSPPVPGEKYERCPFESRCEFSREQCVLTMPDLYEIKSISGSRTAACFFPLVHTIKEKDEANS